MSTKTILIVEDSNIISKIYQMYFEGTDFKIIIRNNPEIGLRYLHKNVVDLILVDFTMPIMNGLEFIKRDIKNTPFILCTSDRKKEFLNIKNILYKPFSKEQLLNKVLTTLET